MPSSSAGLKSLSLILSKGGASKGNVLLVNSGLVDDESAPAADFWLLLHDEIMPIIVANGSISILLIGQLKS